MKRFSLSTFSLSAFSVLVAAVAIAPTAQALPQVGSDFKLQTLRLSELDVRNKSTDDSAFKLQTLRLSEFDARNKSEERSQPYYPQTATPATPQSTIAEQEGIQKAKPTPSEALETAETVEEEDSVAQSVTDRRHQSLDRN